MNSIISENELFHILFRIHGKVLLLEPNYKRKYIPLGLAKLATFLRIIGVDFTYSRKYLPGYDLILVTTLFTYESKKVKECLDGVFSNNENVPVIVGGIFASLYPRWFITNYPNILVFVGYSRILDSLIPDYTIDWEVNSGFEEYNTLFTTRGCTNKCAYCAVWRIEEKENLWINPRWKTLLVSDKPRIMISDNNLTSAPREHVIDVLKTLSSIGKPVLFNNGVDIKYIDQEYSDLLGKIKYVSGGGLTVAFDRIEEDGLFQEKVKMLLNSGVKKSVMKAFVLYNFTDTPQEAHYRMQEVYKLGIRQYPQRYASLNALSRDEGMFVGKHWTKNLTSAFRYYWLMGGCFRKYTFEEAVALGKHRQLKLTDEDWEKWYAG